MLNLQVESSQLIFIQFGACDVHLAQGLTLSEMIRIGTIFSITFHIALCFGVRILSKVVCVVLLKGRPCSTMLFLLVDINAFTYVLHRRDANDDFFLGFLTNTLE